MKVNAPWYNSYGNVPKSIDYPDLTMYQCVEKSAKEKPDIIAYEFMGNNVKYSDLIKEIDIMAAALHNLGIKKGDKVLVCLPNTPQALISLYGINRLGAVANMIHPLSAKEEIKFYLKNSSSKAAIVLDMFYPNFPSIDGTGTLKNIIVTSIKDGLCKGKALLYQLIQGRKDPKVNFNNSVLKWNDFMLTGKGVELPPINSTKDDLACILYSGGTTGRSKGVLHSNMSVNATAFQTFVMNETGKDGDTMLSIMPVFHGLGLCVCVHMVLCMRCTCILIPRFDAKSYASIVMKKKPNYLVGVPSLFELMLRNDRMKNADLSHVNGVVCGGDTLTADLKIRIDKFLKDHNCNTTIREGYGTTECVAATCLCPMSKDMQREGSVGLPYPDTFYKIVRVGTTNVASYEEDGEICISGPSVMIGYLNEPEETADTLRFHDDGLTWLHTGDVGSMDKDGYVYFKQRLKRVIISSGYNIYPSQIENVISSIPFVQSCYAIGIPHPIYSQVVKVFVVLTDDIKPTSETKERIMAVCKENISKYSLPKEIQFLNEMPVTKLGKVHHTELCRLSLELEEPRDISFIPSLPQNVS